MFGPARVSFIYLQPRLVEKDLSFLTILYQLKRLFGVERPDDGHGL